MIIEKGRPIKYDFTFNNSTLDVVDLFRYLGISLFKNGNWNCTQNISHNSHSILYTICLLSVTY